MTIHDLLHRAAEIDVDDGGAAIFIELRRLAHHLGLATGELNRHRRFLGHRLRHFQRLTRMADHRLAVHEGP